MGNLFGTNSEQRPTQESRTFFSGLTSEQREHYVDYVFQQALNRVTNPSNVFSHNHTLQERPTSLPRQNRTKFCDIKKVEKSVVSFNIHNIKNLNHITTLTWEQKDYSTQPVHFVNLNRYSAEYKEIEDLFTETNKKFFKVTQIERVQNPYLLAAFLLKRQEMEERTGFQYIEKLFHGTKHRNVYDICTGNFNWRLYGKNEGNKFGQGVSFTPISYYATFYGDEEVDNRCMLVVNVLTGNECVGQPNMIVPPDGYDTSIKDNRHVIVKYEDNEFYPCYKVTYCCTNHQEMIKRKKKQQYRAVRKQRQNNVNSLY